MSYILDALRKADAERDRGNVPGIHAQPSFGSAAPAPAQPAGKPWIWLAAGALAVLLIGALVWYLTAPPRTAVEAARPASLPTPIAAAPTAAPAPVATPAVPSAAPKTDAPAIARRPRPTPTSPAPATATPTTTADTKPAATGEKVYTVAELPDDIRRQLPAVNIGGAMYSPKAADRILIVNGQVLHEGDRIAPELTLQQIRVKSAVLSFKGHRYTIAF